LSLLSPQAPDTPHDRRRLAWRIAGLYAALASLWILGSDLALLTIFPDAAPAVAGSLAKGGLFIAVTSALLFAFLRTSAVAEASLERIGSRAPLSKRVQWRAVAPFAALAVALIVASGWLFLWETHEHLRHARTALEARAESKAHELELWLKQRAQNALSYRRARFFQEDLPGILRGESAARNRVASRLEQIRKALALNTIFVLDPEGQALLATGAYLKVSADLAKDVAEIARTRTPRLHVPRRAEGGRQAPILIDQIVPVEIGTSGEVAPAVMVLRDDAASTLLPMLRRWIEPSRTAEAYLTRRTGMWIEYLSELREKPEAALTLGAPVTSRDRTAAQLFRGADFLEEAVDYRGKKVMAAGRVVPGTDWRMVVKIDRDEVLGPIRGRAGLFVATLLGIILLSGLGAALLWRQQALLASLRERAIVAEREALIKHYDYLSKFAHDFIFLLDDTGRIVEINDRVTEAYQWLREELIGRPAFELRAPGHDAPEEERQKILRTGSGMIYETVHRRRDGTTFPVEISARGIEVEGRRYVQGIVRDITGRKRAEAGLKQAEERYRALFDRSLDCVFLADMEGNFMDANQAALDLLGYRREEISTVNFQRLLSPDQLPHALSALREVMETGTQQLLQEYTLRQKQGGQVVVESKSSLVYRDGRPFAVLGIARDITARKRAEDALRESEERFRQIAENIREVFWLTDPAKNQMVYISPAYEVIWGRPRSELYASPRAWIDAIHPEDRERVMTAALQDQVLGRYDQSYRIIRPDGSIRWIHDRAVPVRNPVGEIVRIAGIAEDVTEHRQIEDALKEREQRLRDIVEHSTNLFYSHTADHVLTYVSPQARQFFDCEPEEAMVRWTEFLTDNPANRRGIELTQRAIDSGDPQPPYELELVSKQGRTLWVEVREAPIVQNGKTVAIVGALIDITERKRWEARIARLTSVRNALSDINRAIVHADDGDALFADVCAIAVRHTEFILAWVGIPEESTGVVLPLTSAGSTVGLDYLGGIRISFRDKPEGRGPTGTAIQEDRVVVSNDFLADFRNAPWHDAARSSSLRSCAALPLHRQGKVVAVLNVYSGTPGFFDAEIVALLEEMAQDVSFSLEVLAGQRALHENEAQFRAIIEQSISGIGIVQDGLITYANQRCAEIFGYDRPNELIGRSPVESVAPRDRAVVAENLRRVASGEVRSDASNFLATRRDGREVEVGMHAAHATYKGKPAIIAIMQDISERKRAEEEISRYIARLEQAMRSTISVVSAMGELRDPYTHGHERRVGELAAAIATEMGLDENQVEGIRVAGYLHDVGKIGVPAEILSKPARLSKAEYELVKDHAQQSYEILRTVEFPWPVADAAWQHHERLDGSGYPRGLKEGDIIIEARILAVADVVEAMSSHRPYRPGAGIEKALAEIEKNRGKLYDPQAADACLRLFREKGFTIPD